MQLPSRSDARAASLRAGSNAHIAAPSTLVDVRVSDDDFNITVFGGGPPVTGFKSKGWIAGGHAGYNWQFGYVVAGVEGDFSATGIRGSSDLDAGTFSGIPVTATMSDDIKYLGTSRARLGFAADGIGSSFMFYGTAGAAWERVNQTTTILIGPPIPSFSSVMTPTNLFGWVAGVGAETNVLRSNWLVRVEYLHYDFGSARIQNTFGSPGGVSAADRAGSQTLDVVRAGLSYKFGADAAVVARY